MKNMSLYATTALLLIATPILNAQTLSMGASYPIISLDPQFQNNVGNSQIAGSIFEQLVERDTSGAIVPRLSESWSLINDTTWEFKLRPNVKFHNGSDFLADDVAYSISRVRTIENSPSPFTNLVESVKSVEIIDPLTVHIHTHAPNPILPVELAAIFMMDKQTHDGVPSSNFDNSAIVVGTGPLRLGSYRPQESAELIRNDEYWGTKVEWERINYKLIKDDAARVAALLSGGVQFIDKVPPSNVARITSQDNLKVVQSTGLRSMYINLDQTGKGQFAFTNDDQPLPASVLQDVRVRKALSLALDRKALAERIMEGAATGTGQLMPEGTPGYVAAIEVPKADVDEAHALLAEAGYPDGFKLTLHGPNGNYLNDAALAQAVGQMWTRIGVKTEVVVLPFSSFAARASKQEFSAFMSSWGSTTAEAGNTLRSVIATPDQEKGLGSVNRHHYSNSEVDGFIQKFSTEMDPKARLDYMESAMRIAMEDVAVVPLVLMDNIAAMDKTLEYVGRIDGYVQPHDVHPTDK